MPPQSDYPSSDCPSHSETPETRWTLVARAFATSSTEAATALRDLCETYWPTLYRIARKMSLSHEQALETVHDFLCDLLEGRIDLGAAARERGKFRNYLWTTFSHHLIDRRRKSTTKRSGGHLHFVSLESQGSDDRAMLDPIEHLTPDDAFCKSLALDTFDRAMRVHRESWVERGKSAGYQSLTEYLATPLKGERSRALAEKLGVSESRCRGMVTEFRSEFQKIVRNLVAETIQNPTEKEIDAEVDWMWTSLQL